MINVNLLPKELRRATGPDYWRLGAGALGLAALISMLTLQLTVNSTLGGLNRQIDEANSEITSLAPNVRERDQLRAQQTQLTAVTGVADTLRAGQTSWSADLARFVRQLPQAASPLIALNSLTMHTVDAAGTAQQSGAYDGKPVTKEVQVNGKARSSDALVRFVNAFEGAPDFGVQFQNAQREQQSGDYTFAVTVGLVGEQPQNTAQDKTGAAQSGVLAPVSTAPANTENR